MKRRKEKLSAVVAICAVLVAITLLTFVKVNANPFSPTPIGIDSPPLMLGTCVKYGPHYGVIGEQTNDDKYLLFTGSTNLTSVTYDEVAVAHPEDCLDEAYQDLNLYETYNIHTITQPVVASGSEALTSLGFEMVGLAHKICPEQYEEFSKLFDKYHNANCGPLHRYAKGLLGS